MSTRSDEKPRYRVVVASNRVAKELDSISVSDHARVFSQLRGLERNPAPAGSVRLRGDIYGLRVGSIRVIYLIDQTRRTIILGAARRRNEGTYRDIERLF